MEFSPNESLNNTLIENAKKQETQIIDFRLILLDRITYAVCNSHIKDVAKLH